MGVPANYASAPTESNLTMVLIIIMIKMMIKMMPLLLLLVTLLLPLLLGPPFLGALVPVNPPLENPPLVALLLVVLVALLLLIVTLLPVPVHTLMRILPIVVTLLIVAK